MKIPRILWFLLRSERLKYLFYKHRVASVAREIFSEKKRFEESEDYHMRNPDTAYLYGLSSDRLTREHNMEIARLTRKFDRVRRIYTGMGGEYD